MTDKVYLDHNPKTVALVCMGPSVMDFMDATLTQEYKIDFADEIWALNMASNCFNHDVVMWFDDLKQQFDFKPDLIKWLARRGRPVVTATRHPDLVPNSYDFPIDDIARMGVQFFGKPYLNNGVAMSIAYAMWKDVKLLKIYGADFSYPGRDYAESGRACTECWVTVAIGRGMQVQLASRTSLMDIVKDHSVYGYDEAHQPKVNLPGGGVCKYVRLAASATMGKYVTLPEDVDVTPPPEELARLNMEWKPEDSSGQEKANGPTTRGNVPGIEGSPPPDAGDAPNPFSIGSDAEVTIDRSRASFWRREPDRRGRDQGGNSAGHAGA